MIYILTICLTFAIVQACPGKCKDEQPVLMYSSFEDCEGKESANYTLIGEGKLTDNCERLLPGSKNQIISCGSNGQRGTDQLQILASSQYPAGAYQQFERLYLATGGPLDGKFIYEKVIFLSTTYLKKCSSLLGYSYVSTKSSVILISEKLDLQVLISPIGGFEAFKRGCTTVCRGKGYLF